MGITKTENILDIALDFWDSWDLEEKIIRSMPLFSICAAICWIPPRCPARYRWTFRFVTSSMSRPVVSVAYRVFLLRIPLYAMQKFCIKIFFASCATNPMFMICYPLLIFSYLKPYIQNQTDSDTEADKRCQPVAYKGKCKAGVWHQASRNTDVDKALKKDQSSHSAPYKVLEDLLHVFRC